MKQDTVIELKKPETFINDPITELVRQGSRDILFKALEIEIDSFISLYADLKDGQGRQRITRNGYLPERDIQTAA